MDLFVIITVTTVSGNATGTITLTVPVDGDWSRRDVYQMMLDHIGPPPDGNPEWQVLFFSAEPDWQVAS